MYTFIIILGILTFVMWTITILAFKKSSNHKSQKPANLAIISAVITTLWVMLMIIRSLN
ncbi:hypothetical protein [Staphylococcus canis]|uniref:Mid2-like cell wall stress sensor domain protein n=1 Tax=Staphylococcus canis TaxID=2724942 RepID=A0ABS0T6V0_9STAP|nr:hypothetical protein [Staphylococcus canis]MBI5974478.1 hypothetical protein [Staphylococcus canis]